MRFFKNWWVVTILCAVLLILLFCVGLPLVVAALAPLWVRITFLLVIVAGWGLLAFLRRRKAKKAADALAAELAGPNAADEESRALAARMGEALGKLKTASGKRRDYLYTRPWYVIIGPPGSGKTTALLHSGLRFPFSDQAVKGIGGTRNLDFWFADEAVMVDTAGRYTTQDSDQQVDARGWTSMLGLLKKHRPLQPVNGVIVAIGIDELVRSDCAGIDAHAKAVRRRLVELRRELEVAVPVYVMLTKADLLAGFTQYFDDLDVEGRRAVFGSTLDFKDGKATADGLARAFDEMTQAVVDRQAKRLFDEVDPMRRGLLLGFPNQLQSLRSRLMRFLDGAFVTGDEPGGVLRGFYLTSGVQSGAPIDRIMSGMAEVYDRPAEQSAQTSGRAYFLNRLLTEVLFPEAGLVTMDPRARARQQARLVAAFAGIGAIVALTLLAWGVSFARNRAFQGDLLAKATAAETQFREAGVDLKQVRDGDADLRAALPALNALRTLPRGYDESRKSGPPLLMRFGLYQSGLARTAEETYREALRRVMLPRLMLRLEKVMQAESGDPMKLYEPLKVYLMLGQQGPMNGKSVNSWVNADWATDVYPGADSQADRSQLGRHLAVLVDDPNLAAVWPARKPPLDGALVASARAAVGTLSLADRAYAVMKQKASTAGAPWELANILSQGDALAFQAPDRVLAARIPYFFTRTGFETSYTLGLATVQEDLKRDLWVLGENAETGGVREEMSNIRPGVAGLYAKDYIAAWEGILKLLQPGAYFQDAAALGAITKSPSPLKRVLLELRKNTIFAGGTQAGISRLARNQLNKSQAGQFIGQVTSGRAAGIDAGSEITAYFQPVHDYVGSGGAAPVDEFVAALKQAGQAVMAAKSMGASSGSDATQAAMATAVASVKAAAAGAPAQLQSFTEGAAGGGATAQLDAAKGAVSEAYAQNVLPACKEVAEEHYPFFGTATADAATVDVQRVFGMNGTIDGFAQQRVKPLVDQSGPVWRWKSDDPVAATLDPSSPEQFAKAAKIRDLLTGGLPISVSVKTFGSNVGAVEMSSGGTRYRFDAKSNQPRPLIWSVQGLGEASLALFKPAATPADDPAKKFDASGPWALFRLVDQAVKENAGPRAINATFGSGADSATITITLPSEENVFARGGLWSFRCPVTL